MRIGLGVGTDFHALRAAHPLIDAPTAGGKFGGDRAYLPMILPETLR
jgi:hypothetical protein